MKKNILSKVLTLGVVTTPILVGITLINTSNVDSKQDTSIPLSSNVKNNEKNSVLKTPKVPENGIIDPTFVSELITYKKNTITNWDGSLVESDFTNALAVGRGAFKNRTEVTSITSPLSVQSIGADAFSGTSNLKTISILGAHSLASDCFAGMTGVVERGVKMTYNGNYVTYDKIPSWGIEPKYVYITPPNPPPLVTNGIITKKFVEELITWKTVIANDSLGPYVGFLDKYDFEGATTIDTDAFGISSIKSVVLPQSVKTIKPYAFNGASNLTTISALSVTNIENNGLSNNKFAEGGIKLTYSENIKPGNIPNWGTDSRFVSIVGSPDKPANTNIITNVFIKELTPYKISQTNGIWDGSFVESDFVSANTVATNAFQNNTQVTSIEFPTTVKTINTEAFSGASNLTTISALGATSVAANAFAGMTNISDNGIKLSYSENIIIDNIVLWGTIPEKVLILNFPPPLTLNGIITKEFIVELTVYKKYMANKNLRAWNGSFVESDFINATIVATNAFQNNTEVTSIEFPFTVKTINTNAFTGASNLKTISALGATSVAANAFAGIEGINNKGITLQWSEEDNILINFAEYWGTIPIKVDIITLELPKVPTNGNINAEFIVKLSLYKKSQAPNGVWDGSFIESDFTGAISVGSDAFKDNISITSIILPITVKSIGRNAFNGATKLTNVSAPGVTSILDNAFLGTTSLLKIELSYTNFLRDSWVKWGLEITQSNFDKIEWINPPYAEPNFEALPSDPNDPTRKIVDVAFIQNIVLYEDFKLIDGFSGEINPKYLQNVTIDDGAFEMNPSIGPKIKKINLDTSIKFLGNEPLRGSDIETINISINHYPSTGTLGLEQNKFNGLSWTDIDKLLNGGEGVFDALTNKKLFIAKSLNEGLTKMGIIEAKNLNGYTSIAANAFGETVNEIHLPDNFDNITTDREAFTSATNLKEIFIPASSKITPTEFFENYNIKPDVNVKSEGIQQALSDELQNSFIVLAISFSGIIILFISIVSLIFYSNKRKITKFEEMNLQLKKENEENEIEPISDEISE